MKRWLVLGIVVCMALGSVGASAAKVKLTVMGTAVTMAFRNIAVSPSTSTFAII